MEFDTVLIPPRRAYSIEQGLWPERTINDDLDACIADHPDKVALTALQVESGEIRRYSYRNLGVLVDRIAVGLSRLGIGRNDVVSLHRRPGRRRGSPRAAIGRRPIAVTPRAARSGRGPRAATS